VRTPHAQVRVDMPTKFFSMRVGDGELVNGTRLNDDLSSPWKG
jgi:hypothetical protein